MTIQDPHTLIRSLTKLVREVEWVEFKENNSDPIALGKYISALSNSAILAGEEQAFIVFGIHDTDHEIVGTEVRWRSAKRGNEDALHWVNKMLQPTIHLELTEAEIDGKHVEIISINPPYEHPVRFEGVAWIRIESSLHPLNHHPTKEAAIWRAAGRFTFENQKARLGMSREDVLDAFLCRELVEGLAPGRKDGDIIEFLREHKFLASNLEGGFDPYNVLVLVAARNYEDWEGYQRKGIRVVSYRTATKFDREVDLRGKRGYFPAFTRALDRVLESIPNREEIVRGVRTTVYDIPEVAIREILANAIVHQDLTDPTSGPLVEIFPDRVVITNPGEPLVKPERFVDCPSRSLIRSYASSWTL